MATEPATLVSEGYKRTEVGEIPESWEAVSLGSLGEFLKGKGGTKDDERDEGVACVRYGKLYTHHRYIIRGFDSFVPPSRTGDYTSLEPGDVLFAGSGETHAEIGRSAVFLGGQQACAGGDILILRPKQGLHHEFLGYACDGPILTRQKSTVGQGGSVIHIYTSHLAELLCPLPPLLEQQAIADILQSVDDSIRAEEERLTQLETLKRGLMQDLLTGKVRVKVA